MEKFKIYFVTYNVGTSNPEQDVRPLLNLPTDPPIRPFKNMPDIYVLAFQEVKAQPQNMLMNAFFDDPWTTACRSFLELYDYVKIKSIRLQGILLSVFLLRKHLLNVRDMETEYTRTGISGLWGNKGAVSLRLSLYGCSICFVNSHLSAHDQAVKERITDYNTIVKKHEFHVDAHTEIYFHDYVFWMGDLNFRLAEEFSKTPEEISLMVNNNCLQQLLEFDQLKNVMCRGEAFSELKEQDPPFPPTFKFEVDTNMYDLKRRPAWCDRILYRVNPDNYENVCLNAKQLSYKHHPCYKLSDHKPVTADFLIKIPPLRLKDVSENALEDDASSSISVPQVFSGCSECVVVFDEIPCWTAEEYNSAKFRFTQDNMRCAEDWIGVFKENFSSLDDYVWYEYANRLSGPTPEFKSPCKKSKPIKYELTFSELPSRCRGNYCLVYFSQTENKVLSVLGISNAFPIVKSDS